MKRIVFSVIGILGLSLVAAAFTEATLALGHRGHLSDDRVVRPSSTPSPSLAPGPRPTPSPSPQNTPGPTPVPLAPASRTAITNSFVYLRTGPSTSTAIMANLDGGTTLALGEHSDAYWQEVEYHGLNGYVYKDYLIYQ